MDHLEPLHIIKIINFEQSEPPSLFNGPDFRYIASEASFLVCSMARIFAIYRESYIFQAVSRSVKMF